jgi:hypothetical protein
VGDNVDPTAGQVLRGLGDEVADSAEVVNRFMIGNRERWKSV